MKKKEDELVALRYVAKPSEIEFPEWLQDKEQGPFIQRIREQLRKDHPEKLKDRPIGAPEPYYEPEDIGNTFDYRSYKMCPICKEIMGMCHETTRRHLEATRRRSV